MTVGELRRQGSVELQEAGIENDRFEVDCLLAAAVGQKRTWLLLHAEEPVDSRRESRYHALLQRRMAGEPLQYILGEWDFLDITLQLGPGVLIPRPETESLAKIALEAARAYSAPIVVDLCAGSGCIGFSIAKSCPQARVYLIEKYKEAFLFLKINEKQLHLTNTYCILKDIYEGFSEGAVFAGAHILVSNPPYIPSGALRGLQREVQREPKTALNGGADGLDFYRVMAEKWLDCLLPGGALAVECGEGQAEAVAALFRAKGLAIAIQKDFRGVKRFVTATREKE